MRDSTISFDRIADLYDETRAYPAGVTQKIVAAMDEHVPKDGRVLDIGVGTGRLAGPMMEDGFDVTGVDISIGMLEKARRKGLENLALGDARALPFRDRVFRSSVSVHVTHLISDWIGVLSEIARVTSELYASIATHREGCQVEELQTTYEKACREMGHDVRHPGMRERDLAGILSPVSVIEVAESLDHVAAADVIECYQKRIYSDLWDVPEHVHEHGLAKLREVHGSSSHLDRRQRISLILWDVDSIRDYTSAQAEANGDD